MLADGSLAVAPEGATAVELPEAAAEVTVEYALRGVPHRFATNVTGGGPESLFLGQPRAFARVQRRHHFRVAPATGSAATFQSPGGKRRTRAIHDVGAGGLGLLLELGEEEFAPGDLADFEMLMAGCAVVIAAGVVRWVEQRPPAGASYRRCGVEFVRIGLGEQERLMQYVARRERELLGRRKSQRAPAACGSVIVLRRAPGPARVRAVLDFGAGGVALQLVEGEDHDLAPGMAFPRAELRLADIDPIITTATIVWVRRAGADLICGVEFAGLSAESRERIAQRARLASFDPLRPPGEG